MDKKNKTDKEENEKLYVDKEYIKQRLISCRTSDNLNHYKYTQDNLVDGINEVLIESGRNSEKDLISGRSTISNWEKFGQSLPTIDYVVAMCKFLKIDLDYFINPQRNVPSKSIAYISEHTNLSTNSIVELANNTEKAKFINHLLTSNSLNEIINCSNKLIVSSILNDVLTTSFNDDLIVTIRHLFDEFYYSASYGALTLNEYKNFISNKPPKNIISIFKKNFKQDGKLYVYNFAITNQSLSESEQENLTADSLANKFYVLSESEQENLTADSLANKFYVLSESEQKKAIIDSIAEISFDYLMHEKTMDTIKAKLIHTFSNIIDEYVSKETQRFHRTSKNYVNMTTSVDSDITNK